MRVITSLTILLLFTAHIVHAANPVPAVPTLAGQRAFDDLARLYDQRASPDLDAMWKRLHSPDQAARQDSGDYLLALFEQSFADEMNGRTDYSRSLPAFGQRPASTAREFRKQLAKDLPENAATVECLAALQWIIEHDVLSDAQRNAAMAVRQIHAPAADDLLISLLSPPHSNCAVLTIALEEAAARGNRIAAAQIPALSVYYRSDVRAAARAAADRIGPSTLPTYIPEDALAASYDADLQNIVAMITTPISNDASFVAATIQYPAKGAQQAHSWMLHGWLLNQTPSSYELLDENAVMHSIPKEHGTFITESLATRAQALLDVRRKEAQGDLGDGERSRDLSHFGSLSGQFEPGQARLPEILVAAWAYQRNDRKLAARLLLPRLDELDDRRWLVEIARDLLGNHYDREMLTRLCDYWDFPATTRLAQHLSSPLFNGFERQYRAKILLQQLPRRAHEDFHTLVMPTPAQWHDLRRHLSRIEQIDFLADRLRLISCRQWGWPSDVNLRDEQRSVAGHCDIYQDIDRGRGVEAINPYAELGSVSKQ